jgi:integrase
MTLVSTLSINRPPNALKGNKMLVKEYFELEIANRPYKYQTKLNMVRCLKKLELWEMEYEILTPAICWERIDEIINQNVKRTYAGYVRNVFNYGRNQIPVVMGESKIYDLPTQEDLHKVIESSKYRFYLFLCMYAGLRIGEACAVVPQQVKKEGLNYFLHVDRAFSQDGKSFGSPKTVGKVMIPEWLALEILTMKEEQYWKKGMPTKLITTACMSLGTKNRKRIIRINPHMLRHWFATDMIKRGVNPEVARRQLRHKNIETTMKIYVQVNDQEIESSIPMRPQEKRASNTTPKSERHLQVVS